MRLTDVITFLLSALTFGAGLGGLFVLCNVAFPQVIARARGTADKMPIRSFLVGLINFIFFGLIAVALLSSNDVLRIFGLIVAAILLGLVAVGLSAMARLVGERLQPAQPSAMRQLLVGIITLELAALAPFVGWLLVPALAGLTGYGAVMIALIWRRTEPEA